MSSGSKIPRSKEALLFFTTDYPNKTNIINQDIEKLIISSLILFETIDRI